VKMNAFMELSTTMLTMAGDFLQQASRARQSFVDNTNLPPEDLTSPIQLYIGTGFTADEIDVRVVHGQPSYIVVTAEEQPLDILGAKSRIVQSIPEGTLVTGVKYEPDEGIIKIFVTIPEVTGGEKVAVDIEGDTSDT
jgi:hypothetical protein